MEPDVEDILNIHQTKTLHSAFGKHAQFVNKVQKKKEKKYFQIKTWCEKIKSRFLFSFFFCVCVCVLGLAVYFLFCKFTLFTVFRVAFLK